MNQPYNSERRSCAPRSRRSIRCRVREREQSDLMTEYNAADLLSRLRAERTGILEARKELLKRRSSGTGAGVPETAATTESGEVVRRVDVSHGDGADFLNATLEADAELDDSVTERYDTEVLPDEELSLLRAIRAKADRVEARLESLQTWVTETRSWIESFETAHRTQADLGRIVLESQARIDMHTKAAEERADRIIAEAKEQAEQLLAAAEIVAAEIISADVGVVEGARDLDAEPTAAAPVAEAPVAAEVPVATEVFKQIATVPAVDLSAEDAEDLYEVIELFTRTNAELVNELSALIGAIPRRGSK